MKEWKPSLLAFHLTMENFWAPMSLKVGLLPMYSNEKACNRDIATTVGQRWIAGCVQDHCPLRICPAYQMLDSYFMRAEPKDVLMTLRPIPTFNMPVCEEARAAR